MESQAAHRLINLHFTKFPGNLYVHQFEKHGIRGLLSIWKEISTELVQGPPLVLIYTDDLHEDSEEPSSNPK